MVTRDIKIFALGVLTAVVLGLGAMRWATLEMRVSRIERFLVAVVEGAR